MSDHDEDARIGSDATAGARRRYEKPRITRVLLRPDEAVLGFCKNANRSGPIQAKCTTPVQCSTKGS